MKKQGLPNDIIFFMEAELRKNPNFTVDELADYTMQVFDLNDLPFSQIKSVARILAHRD